MKPRAFRSGTSRTRPASTCNNEESLTQQQTSTTERLKTGGCKIARGLLSIRLTRFQEWEDASQQDTDQNRIRDLTGAQRQQSKISYGMHSCAWCPAARLTIEEDCGRALGALATGVEMRRKAQALTWQLQEEFMARRGRRKTEPMECWAPCAG
jgi:hypothetical protein